MLETLTIKDFMCFKGRTELDLSDRLGIIPVVGSYEGEPERSNQAGKTTVMAAIRYALYGWDRSLADIEHETELIYEENGQTADHMEVSLVLLIDGERLSIRRGRTASNQPIFEIEGVGGHKDELQQEISRRLGLNCKDFMATAYFQQGDIHTFMHGRSSERQKVLKRWLDFTRWDNYASDAGERVKLYEGEEQNLLNYLGILEQRIVASPTDQSIPTLEEERARRMGQAENAGNILIEKEKELRNQPNDTELAKKVTETQEKLRQVLDHRSRLGYSVKQAEAKVAQAKANQKEIVQLGNVQENLDHLKTSLEQLDATIQQASVESQAYIRQAEELYPEIERIEQESRKALTDNAAVASEKKSAQSLLTKLTDLGGHCPFDRKPCDRVGPQFIGETQDQCNCLSTQLECLAKQVDELRLKKAEVVTKRKSVMDRSKEVARSAEKARIEHVRVTKEISGCQTKLQRLSFLSGQISIGDAEEALRLATKSVEEVDSLVTAARSSVEVAEAELVRIRQDDRQRDLRELIQKAQQLRQGALRRVGELDRELGAIRERQAAREKAEQEKVKTERDLAECRRQLGQWRFLVSALGKEIPSILTENAFEELESEINYILKELYMDMRVQFQAVRELRAKEDVCSVCGTPYPKRATACQCGYGVRGKKKKESLSIKVLQGNSIRPFSLVSGGGKALVSLAWRIAASRLLQRRRGARVTWLQMDEIFGSLDLPNRTTVVRLILDVLLQTMGFSQIFLISHTPVADVSDNILRVTRYKTYSTIDWVASEEVSSR